MFYKNTRVTERDLRGVVQDLNKQYKKTKKTAVRFAVESAYGGHKVVLRNNQTGGVKDITYGYLSPREAINSVKGKERKYLSYDVKRFHKTAMDIKKGR